jgi:DNA-binding response OmpR family regulator
MRHVLVVDDDPDICQMLAEALDFDGAYRVTCAHSLAEAREKIAVRRPDRAVVDVVLRGASGLELAHELATMGVPVMLISANPRAMHQPAAHGLPWLAKPFRLSALMMWLADTDGMPATRSRHMQGAPDMVADGA